MSQVGPSQRVYDFIIEQIRDGKWLPGDKISGEMELCQTLDVSRVATRQALEKLSAIGLLRKRQGSGTFVAKLNAANAADSLIPLILLEKQELLMLLEFRLYFEVANIEIAVDNFSAEEIVAIEDTYTEMLNNKEQPVIFSNSDFRFHQLIAESTRNTFIIKISNILTEVLKSHQAHLNERIGSEVGLSYHGKIIQAIKDKDKEMSSLLMKRHIQAAINAYKKTTDNSSGSED